MHVISAAALRLAGGAALPESIAPSRMIRLVK
jgi:hypothetical protein